MPGTRWLTFDCYGTIADWNACMLGALQPIAGGHAASLLATYHRAESILEAQPEWRPYREILTDGLGLAARRSGIAVTPSRRARSWRPGRACRSSPTWPRRSARSCHSAGGWQSSPIATMTCSPRLPRSLPVPFEVLVTAEQVRSYKPDLGHFRKFAEMTGATPANWVHVANSWVHDILPATRMGLRSVWVDRDHTGHPAKLAERRVTTMRRLAETVTDVSVLPAWPAG